MIKTIKDFDLKGKRVIIRCDLNVPIISGEIADDNRIVESLPTIKYALKEEVKESRTRLEIWNLAKLYF